MPVLDFLYLALAALARSAILPRPFSRKPESISFMAHQKQGRRRNKPFSTANHGKRPTRKIRKPLGQTSRDRRAKGR